MRTLNSRDVRTIVALTVLIALTALPTACNDEDDAATATVPPGGSRTSTLDEAPNGQEIVADGGELPNGTYRVEFSEQHLADHGLDGAAVANNRGTWTTSLDDGQWSVHQVAPDLTDRFSGVYQVVGDNLYWRFHDTHEVLHLKWSTDDQGDLSFTQVSSTGSHPDFQFALPWTRVE